MLLQVFHSTPTPSWYWVNPVFQSLPQFATGITKTLYIKRGEKIDSEYFYRFPLFQ